MKSQSQPTPAPRPTTHHPHFHSFIHTIQVEEGIVYHNLFVVMMIDEPNTSTVCTTVDVVVPSNRYLSRSIRAEIVAAFVQHILYMRGQIPTPFAQLQAQAQAHLEEGEMGTFKRRAATRKADKFVMELSQLLTGVRDIFTRSPEIPDKACLLLGASARCPRERFTISFTQSSCESDMASDAPDVTEHMMDQRIADALKRRVIRELVTQWTGGDVKARLLNAFIAVHSPSESDGEHRHLLSGIDHFGVVEDFCPRIRRRSPLPLICTLREQCSSEDRSAEDTLASHLGSSSTWFVSRRGVRPLKATGRN